MTRVVERLSSYESAETLNSLIQYGKLDSIVAKNIVCDTFVYDGIIDNPVVEYINSIDLNKGVVGLTTTEIEMSKCSKIE